ncbi:MAG: FHA domain-containing protein [Geobacteraceae bacterium]|nr:FHA domain-containing protein [Geobacteraceae bacterium]NTW80615.1 FHA domain-containing protein [Geobacteraceae bacterium]
MNSHQFPRQKVLCDENPFSRELLHSLLDMVYAASPPFTGYLKIAGDESSLHFLFFFNGAPYAAGRYADGKPISYSIQEFGERLASSTEEAMSATLCETDPVLLKCMLLFLQEEPDVKAPTSLIDIEHIVREIGEVGTNAMIALCRNKQFNFFFFKDGKGAIAYYADPTFERPDGMTIDEEMLLYSFQPGDKVQAFVFREMLTTQSGDSSLLDKDSLYKLLTERSLKSKDTEVSSKPAMNGAKVLVKALSYQTKLPCFVLSVESGPLRGKRFTVTIPCTIGRRGCDLTLDYHRISQLHAELKMVGNKLEIENMAGSNITKVNGETITKKSLIPNDLISIGPINLRISPAYGRRAGDFIPDDNRIPQ